MWESILKDPRHRDITVLANRETPFRLFTKWSMRFAHRGQQYGPFMDGFVEAETMLLNRLHLKPEEAPRILACFSHAEATAAIVDTKEGRVDTAPRR